MLYTGFVLFYKKVVLLISFYLSLSHTIDFYICLSLCNLFVNWIFITHFLPLIDTGYCSITLKPTGNGRGNVISLLLFFRLQSQPFWSWSRRRWWPPAPGGTCPVWTAWPNTFFPHRRCQPEQLWRETYNLPWWWLCLTDYNVDWYIFSFTSLSALKEKNKTEEC